MIIAIDGPAGSGKSSTARAVAHRLGFRHLDSGAFYRALTFAALRAGLAPERWPDMKAEELDALGVHARATESGYHLYADDEDLTAHLRGSDVNQNVSAMASVPAVRDWLMGQLRGAARLGSLVADGRDIGTIVFPDAELKIFLTADPAERARRRLVEQGIDPGPELDGEVERLTARDRADSERATAPLRQADDAVLLDTSGLRFDEQVERIVDLAVARGAAAAD